jgi:hypothetical protein
MDDFFPCLSPLFLKESSLYISFQRIFKLTDFLFLLDRLDEEEIETKCDALRKKLTSEAESGGNNNSKNSTSGSGSKGLKAHQVHELAAAKIQESEKLRKALGIREDYEEGSHWRRQEERLREGVREKGRGNVDEKRKERDNERDESSDREDDEDGDEE